MLEMLTLVNEDEFNRFLNRNDGSNIIIHFGADWAPQCKQINSILDEVNDKSKNTVFVYVEAEKLPQVALQYKVTSVPTLLFLRNKQVIQTINGGNPRDLLKAIKEICETTPSSSTQKSLEEQIKEIIRSDKVMLFMKGSPKDPKCGFSSLIVKLLAECNLQFKHFDILTNKEIREGLKKYSNWPTYPQLYINNELIGGLDIVQELVKNGELVALVKSLGINENENLNDKLKRLINKDKVVLFIKGTPDNPKCGFSRNTVQILRTAKYNNCRISFDYFDILSDAKVRDGLKKYSNWPTYPQLYVNGELIGGFDIIKEMNESGELVDVCKK